MWQECCVFYDAIHTVKSYIIIKIVLSGNIIGKMCVDKRGIVQPQALWLHALF